MGQDTSQVQRTVISQQKYRPKDANVPEPLSIQQELLRTQLFVLTHDAVILCDNEQRIIALNPTAEQLYGWSEQEAKGHNPHTLLQSSAYRENEIGKDVEKGPQSSPPSNEEYWEGKLVQRCKNGMVVVVKCRQSWLYNEHGEHSATLLVCQDISTQQQNAIDYYHHNESLLKMNQKVNTILESITDGIINFDPHWNVVYMNNRAAQLLRIDRQEMIGQDIWKKLPHLIDSTIYRKLHLALQTQQHTHFEMFFEPWQVWFDVHLYPSGDGITAFYNDVTDYKQTEIALRTSQTRLRRIFETNLIGMTVSDTYGNIIEANDALLSIIGYTQEDIQNGLNWRQITPPEYVELSEQVVEEIYQNGLSQPFEKEYLRKDGTRVPVLFVGALIDRNTDTYTSLVIDMTLHKELERQRETFMSIIGHELRTPLTAINGSLQLAQRRIQRFMQGEPTLSTEAEMLLNKLLKLLDQSLRQARVQNRLINDMLDISRLAIDKLELSLQPHNLIDIVRETVDDLRYTESYHTIDLNVPPQNDIQVLADSDRIGQVISNYITNALKYSPPDKPIKVWVELRENDVRVCVHDQGPGLSEEAQKHIWDRYYRANTSKEQKKQGVNLGLGLHICQVLIKRHHGQVGVESTEGEGSTFWFSLPLLQ